MVEANSTISAIMHRLKESIHHISNVTEVNFDATEQLRKGVQQALGRIAVVSGISQNNASTIDEISANTENAKNQAGEVRRVSKELTGVAKELKATTSQFI